MVSAFLVQSPTHHALRALNYTPEVEAFRRRSGQRQVPLKSLLRSIGPAYGAVFTRLDCDRANGVELITQGDMFAAEPDGRIIRRDSMARPERHLVRRWQVLIAGAGTLGENELYGRAIIADDRLAGRYVGPHAMVLTFDDEGSDLNLYTYAFLCSRIGLKAIRSASFGTKILGVRKDVLGDLPVPIADEATVGRVAALIRRAATSRGTYATELRQARGVIEALPDVAEAGHMCRERRARCVTWSGELPTLDAWNFASTGGALSFLSARWSGRLADLVQPSGIFNGPRFARVTCSKPHGIEFYSQRDVFLIRPAPQRIVRPAIPDRMLFVSDDTILAGSHGQMSEGSLFGRVELATFGAARAGLTQDLLRVQPKPGLGALLYTFLSTDLGQRLFKSTAVGTSIPSVRIDLAARLPVPELSHGAQAQVARALASAVAARMGAMADESEAIRIIEEEVLPQWLA